MLRAGDAGDGRFRKMKIMRLESHEAGVVVPGIV